MKLAIGIRMQGFTEPGSAGVVTDTLFVNCYWPRLDRPTRIFSGPTKEHPKGSYGIRVMGTTPRNVWFPDDVVFESFYPDALYPAEQAVMKAFPFNRRGLVDLSPAESDVWLRAYQEAVASFPPTHAVHDTPRHVNFLIERKELRRRVFLTKEATTIGPNTTIPAGTEITKIDYDEYVAELTPEEAKAIAEGSGDEEALRQEKTFVHCKTNEPMVK